MAVISEKKPKLDEVTGRVARVTQSLLEDGAESSHVAVALTSVAADMALQVARAVSDVAGSPTESRKCVQRGESAMRFKRKSDRDRRSSNVTAERKRSLTSRDVSALRAAFRRCHSDSEFRFALLPIVEIHEDCHKRLRLAHQDRCRGALYGQGYKGTRARSHGNRARFGAEDAQARQKPSPSPQNSMTRGTRGAPR